MHFVQGTSVVQVRLLMQRLRSMMSKEYWDTVKGLIKYDKKATIATSFRMKEDENGNKVPAITFQEYIRNLFATTPQQHQRSIGVDCVP